MRIINTNKSSSILSLPQNKALFNTSLSRFSIGKAHVDRAANHYRLANSIVSKIVEGV